MRSTGRFLTLPVTLALAGAMTFASCGNDDGGGIAFTPLDTAGPITIQALERGDIDIAVLFSSQGIIADKGWVVLEDDKKVQPADNLVPVIRTDKVNDAIATVLNEVSAALTTSELSAMNLRYDRDKEDAAKLATEWLTAEGLLEAEPALTGSLVIGSTNFGEQEIMANIYAEALEARGMSIQLRLKLGSREVVAPALEKGDIDLYPEYTGTYLTFLGGTASGDLAKVMTDLRAAAGSRGVTVLEPSPADDVNALVVTRATADKYGLRTISDLAKVSDRLTLGGPPECPERDFCIKGYREVYGLQFDV